MFNWNTSRWPKNDELLAGQCALLCVGFRGGFWTNEAQHIDNTSAETIWFAPASACLLRSDLSVCFRPGPKPSVSGPQTRKTRTLPLGTACRRLQPGSRFFLGIFPLLCCIALRRASLGVRVALESGRQAGAVFSIFSCIMLHRVASGCGRLWRLTFPLAVRCPL